MEALEFKEVQKANSPLIILLAAFPAVLILTVLIYQFVTGDLVGNNPASNLALSVMFIFFGITAWVIIARLKLVTHIDSEKIGYGFNFPTKDLNYVLKSDIKACHLINYRFSGFGYHLTKQYGIVYNISGNQGIQIVKQSGEKLLIGTQKGEELKQWLEKKV